MGSEAPELIRIDIKSKIEVILGGKYVNLVLEIEGLD